MKLLIWRSSVLLELQELAALPALDLGPLHRQLPQLVPARQVLPLEALRLTGDNAEVSGKWRQT